MDKKLPGIFANKIEKRLDNNRNISVTKKEEIIEENLDGFDSIIDNKDINKKINSIFSSPKYVYKVSVTITLKDKVITKRIIGKNNKNLITIENELIPIDDIVDIEFTK